MRRRIILSFVIICFVCISYIIIASIQQTVDREQEFEATPSTVSSDKGISPFYAEELTLLFLEDYDQLWVDLLQNYPFFPILEARGIDTQEVQTQYRLLVQEASSVEEFMIVLDRMFSKLQCFAHLSLIRRDRYDMLLTSFSDRNNIIWEPWISTLKSKKTKTLYQNMLNENVFNKTPEERIERRYYPEIKAAYFRFPSMMPTVTENDQIIISEYLAELPVVNHIIIDVTGNTGGSTEYWKNVIVEPFGGHYSANYRVYYQNTPLVQKFYKNWGLENIATIEGSPSFANSLNTVFFKDYTIDTNSEATVSEDNLDAKRWVLIDEKVYSAADHFASFCKMTGWATLVGTQTGGDGLGGQPVLLDLKNTGLLVYFTVGLASNPDGTLNAEKGTQPDLGCLPKEHLSPLKKCIQIIGGLDNSITEDQ